MKIEATSATRIDLAGGTLDCWPLYLLLDRPITVNLGINLFTKASLRARSDGRVSLRSIDREKYQEHSCLESALQDQEPAFELVRWHLKHWRPKSGFDLEFGSESPVGAGLGGSSSLCISLLKVFSQWMGEHLEDDAMVRLAANLEAQVLKKPTGTQDYYPALRGGVCSISYLPSGPSCNRLSINTHELGERLLLVHTGRTHHSGMNNWEVMKAVLDGAPEPMAALQSIADVSRRVARALREHQLADLKDLLSQETEARLRLSPAVGCPELTSIREISLAFGAAVKICGAGGGGTVLVWTEGARKSALRSALASAGFQAIEAEPWAEGDGPA
jgi:D-glycero-alpha-D-manno-heptose-7-phosphate kinase